MTGSRPATHFERLYQSNPDPWGFNTSPYEQAKYRQTLAVLDDQRFASCLEVGCSIGILTRMLAPRCDSLLGIDIVEDPLKAARSRCADQSHVRFQRVQVPAEWPAGRFDLIIFSEVLYFLAPWDIDRCADHVTASLMPGGEVVMVNWLGQTDDPTTGDDAAERFISATAGSIRVIRSDRHEGYRLDLLANPL